MNELFGNVNVYLQTMKASQELKKMQLMAARSETQVIDSLQSELTIIDPNAQLLSLGKALVSRRVIKKLWDLLPGEHLYYQFDSIQELVNEGKQFLTTDIQATITLHCGWDVLAFAATLESAWESMARYCEISTDTNNTCIYPESLNWYLIRAGTNLYPMDCLTEGMPILIYRCKSHSRPGKTVT